MMKDDTRSDDRPSEGSTQPAADPASPQKLQKFNWRTTPWIPASVHVFTAIGAVIAMLATLAVLRQDWEGAFIWLGVALAIDAIDGPFARRVQVKERLPRFSGETLDLIIDYLTYVFIPVLMLLQAGRLTGTSGVILASLILLSSLYHVSDTQSKADDNCFVGFPATWNIIVFYVFSFALTELATSLLVALFVVLTFIPMKWVHPVRVIRLRPVTLLVAGLWFVVATLILYQGFPAVFWQQVVLALAALYAGLLSLSHGLHKVR